MQIQKTKLWEILTAPFSDCFPQFISLLFVISIININDLIARQLYPYAIYVFAIAFLTSYVFTLVYRLLKVKPIRKIYVVAVVAISMAFLIIDIVCQVQFNTRFSADIAAIILGTNAGEINDFFETFISLELFLKIIFYVFLSIVVYLIAKRIKKYSNSVISAFSLVFLFITIGMTLRNPSAGEEVIVGKISAFVRYEVPEDLHEYLTNPSLSFEEDMLPSNIVIVIGESFAKTHSSLYGYEKDTNPKLSALRDSLSLVVYKDVTSAATHTIPAFKCIMSTYKPEYRDSVKWYSCTTLIEVLQKCGYYTQWYSNQSKNGLFDNVVGRYADLCDADYFVGNKYAGMMRTTLDEEVIDLAIPHIQNMEEQRNAYIFHLMGSHSNYKNRYPSSFDIFKSEDYLSAKPSQKQIFAEYDNSILYNDSVVSEIMGLFKNKEAVVFYYSDHGQDFYNSSEDYCGHGIDSNPESAYWGTQIPFMVYMSDRYKEKYPEKVRVIEGKADEPFRTDDFIYMLMDIIGVKFASDTLPTRIRQNN
ncbi:MAG: sulfatase-like hydrolase/transferase [Bacteroidales bacterium]|nr:sulfatase-like hydrolase/transferase [Bacteroidales bacterium]